MQPKIYMAPMSGITDLAFRLVSRKFGSRLCFLEMLDAKALCYGHAKTTGILKTLKKDSPLAAQLLGCDPQIMLEAAEKLIDLLEISFLDINSACPVRKVLKRNEGADLLRNPAKLGKIIKKLSSKLHLPITVKLRSGFEQRNIKECVKTALTCQDNGASTIFIHARLASQKYAGDVDYEAIRKVKEALDIPVFGSGNIFNPYLAKKMLDETGCDGILVARGALGNPWIFKDIEYFLKTGKINKPPALSAKKKVLLEHLSYLEKFKDMSPGNKVGLMGKISMWYLRGLHHAAVLREHLSRVKTYQELIQIIDSAQEIKK